MTRFALPLLLSLALPAAAAEAALTISKSQSTAWDPLNGSLLPKAVPGAQIDYVITVSNALFQSTARGVTITDAIPSRVSFHVGTGNPVTVTIGALSGLTYSYTSLSSSSDGLDFSNDNGATWTYTPVAGADGSDPNVTNIRVRTGGSQVAGDSFTIRFRAVVK
ncbi:hypothetical protein [Rhizorhabdus dicambivorans]|uniref:DUF11 domain-containing protein n=1 Tax=Rhizorhabdus dicambivorans TaxID=1850238 RepID=A0A2A4FST5_9SPHN|nr:hypothetical protein [Rhizorhabdus dicambivorans]ATE64635.1 hypothetical protein CMV14_09640 [Rhizorhabdus dicambivorans]PCE40756.1 hypothetical protein COO09_18750 [Rhizorhabdus dicambivorans]